jgi:hypothetical protein
MFTFIMYGPTIDKLLGTESECEQIPFDRSGASEGNILTYITFPCTTYSYEEVNI